ncbi:YciI family protein [Nocardia salmonicida]|uniref:YciI family protein n=1 Tax=Nocardia salmonicida TaxID=53431 RepID=UPI00366C9C4D
MQYISQVSAEISGLCRLSGPSVQCPEIAVTYHYDPELADARAAVRAEHNEWLAALVDEGQAMCTGPFSDGGGGLLIFEAASEQLLVVLLGADPFARGHLIESRRPRRRGHLHRAPLDRCADRRRERRR